MDPSQLFSMSLALGQSSTGNGLRSRPTLNLYEVLHGVCMSFLAGGSHNIRLEQPF